MWVGEVCADFSTSTVSTLLNQCQSFFIIYNSNTIYTHIEKTRCLRQISSYYLLTFKNFTLNLNDMEQFFLQFCPNNSHLSERQFKWSVTGYTKIRKTQTY